MKLTRSDVSLNEIDGLSPQEIQDIARELSVDTPILSYRVVGNRVELYLLGGATAVYEKRKYQAADPSSILSGMTVKELHAVAMELAIDTPKRMKKAELIEVIMRLEPIAIADAIAIQSFRQ